MKIHNMNRIKKAMAFILTVSMLLPGAAMAAHLLLLHGKEWSRLQ